MKSRVPLIVGLLAFGCAAWSAAAAELKAIPLWPGKAPGETKEYPAEADTTKPTDRAIAGRPLIRLGNVSTPTLTIYPAPAAKATGAAVLVCPGGGYNVLAWDLEGTEVCEWLNSIGVTAALLKYRVPRREGIEKHAAPLQDAQRALGLLRAQAGELGLDPKRIGILGFSAGGHLAAVLSNQPAARTYPEVDAADKVSCRPDFTVLIYPAYLTVKEKGDAIAPELPVSAANTPPTFIAQTQDDSVRVETGVYYYIALKNAKVPVEMHLYPRGGHGYGLRRTADDVTSWPDRVSDWMKTTGLLKAGVAR
jgi:acetyl esterase/lipase